jgi:hypothetical protein
LFRLFNPRIELPIEGIKGLSGLKFRLAIIADLITGG